MNWDEQNGTQQPEQTQPDVQETTYNYYCTGTVRPSVHRPGLFILFTLFAILLCTIVSLLMTLRVQVKREDGQIVLYVSDVTEKKKNTTTDADADASMTTQSTETAAAASNAEQHLTLQISDNTALQVLTLQQIYSKVIPSVVSIINQSADGEATGTGIIMSADGYIITNYHVIQSSNVLQVLLQNDSTYPATLISSDETSDLAVLKIDATGLTPAEFGNSDTLQVGDAVVAIGDPLGTHLRGTMTNGIVSAINRDLAFDGRSMTLIQTNATLNSGNSGGPLINMNGQVIGINTMKISSSYTSTTVEGLGFAIPISVAKDIVDELLDNGYVTGRPTIGITGDSVPVAAQAYYQLPAGVYVRSIDKTSNAYEVGLRPGDIITAVNGTAISTMEELNTIKNQFHAGNIVQLSIYHSGKLYELTITLMEAAHTAQ